MKILYHLAEGEQTTERGLGVGIDARECLFLTNDEVVRSKTQRVDLDKAG